MEPISFEIVLAYLGEYVFGSSLIVGFWLLLLFFGLLSAMRIEFTIGIVLLMPLTIVLMVYGIIFPVAGGLLLLVSGIILAGHFFTK